METLCFDHIVIGSGLAGLTFALELASDSSVCVLTKGVIVDSNTQWAQGGIAAAVGEADSWELHEADTLIAGAGLCNLEAVRFLVQQAPAAVSWLQSHGTQFDTEDKNELALGREGGHSRHRIVHHQDRTGWEVERAISAAVRLNPSISVYEHAFALEVLVEDGRCYGVRAHIEGLGETLVLAKTVLLATGGAGKLYTHSTNPSVATADGIALAAQAGAEISNMEFMQFHPTTLYHPQMRSFLITEAVRGAGGTLRNHLGTRFMYDYDDRLELAPRDIVARAIEAEMKKHETWCVYLDLTHLPKPLIVQEFPTIYERLEAINLRIEKDWIPVVPAQHYSCGGVVTNLNAETNIAGLYASGECACTGVHGANRLASNSLLEALVFSRSAAQACKQVTIPRPTQWSGRLEPLKYVPENDSVLVRRALQRTMTKNVGIVRTDKGQEEAQAEIKELVAQYVRMPSAPFSIHSRETWNLLHAAEYVVSGGLARTENVGLYFNSDLAPLVPARVEAESVPMKFESLRLD